MRIDPVTHARVLKLVFSGPPLSGKTTNLNGILSAFPQLAGILTAVDLHSERTLRLTMNVAEPLATVDAPTTLEIVTVPGQNYYAATRKAMLDGVDGIVFVADSRREAIDENIESMNEMLTNMRQLGYSDDLPVVMQYNKQDLPTAVKREQFEPLMNSRGWQSFSSSALNGDGIAETLRSIVGMMLARVPTTQPVDAAPSTWLISCHRCQAMLEVPDARHGTAYTCGVCNATMEVYDTDRGLTRPPEIHVPEVDPYQLQTIKPSEDSALNVVDRTPATQLPPLSGKMPGEASFVLPGYTIISTLDNSPQGQRYRVKDANGFQSRALVLHPLVMRSPGYREELEPFVRLAAQVKHPFILPMTGMTQMEDAAVFLSNDPPDYEPLTAILARRRALAPPHVIGILRQVALALEEAARHGVTHGWLRPDVILVNPDGAVVIDELCVPKPLRLLIRESSGISAATEYNLAPEYLSDESRANIRSDMFIIGSLMFRMLTSEGLVTGYNAHDALHKIATNGPRTLRSAQPNISRDLDQLFQRLVSTERKDRCQTYRELIDLFDRFGGGAQRQALQLTKRVGSSASGMSPIIGNRSGLGTGLLPNERGQTASPLPRPGTAEFRRNSGNTGAIRRTASVGSGHQRPSSSPKWKPTEVRKAESSSLGLTLSVLLILAVFGGAIGWYLFAPQRQTPNVNDLVSPTPTAPLAPSLPTASATPVIASQAAPYVTPQKITPTPAPALIDKNVDTDTRIQTLIKQERYSEALQLAKSIPQAGRRSIIVESIISAHDLRHQAVENECAATSDVAAIRALLAAPINTWGLPGDTEWAKALLARAEKNAGIAPNQVPVTVPTITPPPQTPSEITRNPTDAAIQAAYSEVISHLAHNQPTQASQAVTRLDSSLPEVNSLTGLISAWSTRTSRLRQAFTERGQRLHIAHPITKQTAEVTRIDSQGVTVTGLDGSTLDISWNTIPLPEQIRLCVEIAEAPGAQPDDLSLAVGMILIGSEPLLANAQLKHARSSLDGDTIQHLETLIMLGRRGDILALISQANAAFTAGNIKTYNDILEQLKRTDVSSFPECSDDIQRLENQRTQIASAPADHALPDRILFDNQDDLKSFTDVTGVWKVSAGAAINTGDAKFARKDMANTKTLQFFFTAQSTKGSCTIDFRGAHLVVDLGAGTWQIASRKESFVAKPVTLIPRAVNSLQIDYRPSDNVIRVELNNPTQNLSVRVDAPLDTMMVSTTGGAVISVDEVVLTRMAALRSPPTETPDQADLRQLGWEPLGDAKFTPPAIVLPANAAHPSGISMPLRDTLAGLSFDVKGTGNLRINLGRPDGSGQWVDVGLLGPTTPMSIRLNWNATTLTVANSAGLILGSAPITMPPTQVVITALKEAVILSTPRSVMK